MHRIEETFHQLRRKKKKAFLAFITCGDPDLSTTEKLALEFEKLGVDILELGVPFSDPLADGPVIQAASQRALKNKINLKDVFNLVKRLRRRIDMPIVLLTYYNIIFHFGIKRFAQQATAAGVDGVIVPDLPVEESTQLNKAAKDNELDVILLLAPTSDKDRIKSILAKSSGFIYYVSLTGTTGVRKSLSSEVVKKVRQIKMSTKKPVCVGFGVSTPEQAKVVAAYSDGVIVGSAIVRIIESNLKHKKDLVAKTVKFLRKLRKAI